MYPRSTITSTPDGHVTVPRLKVFGMGI